MAKTIHLQIVTPRKVVFEGDVEKFTAPGVMGPFQILFNHAPIVAALTPGHLHLTTPDGKTENYAVAGGIVELHQNKATVLADAVETKSEIDIERARRSMERAQQRLRTRQGVDVNRAEAAMSRANARLRIAGATINIP
jgi:F-type H+-transporting ATPase subunit epsilon